MPGGALRSAFGRESITHVGIPAHSPISSNLGKRKIYFNRNKENIVAEQGKMSMRSNVIPFYSSINSPRLTLLPPSQPVTRSMNTASAVKMPPVMDAVMLRYIFIYLSSYSRGLGSMCDSSHGGYSCASRATFDCDSNCEKPGMAAFLVLHHPERRGCFSERRGSREACTASA